MKRFAILFIVIFSSMVVYAQDDIYQKYTSKTWRNNPAIDKQIDTLDIDFSLLNAVIFFRTNEVRIENGKSELKYNLNLEKSSVIHSDDMVLLNFHSHINHKNISRRSPDDRVFLTGGKNPHIAENIAINFLSTYTPGKKVYVVDAQEGLFSYTEDKKVIQNHTYLSFAENIVSSWMESEGHRANILSDDAIELGCGTAFLKDKKNYNMPKIVAVQNFQFFEPLQNK